MSADEEGTHERIRAHHRELIDPKIREHRAVSLRPRETVCSRKFLALGAVCYAAAPAAPLAGLSGFACALKVEIKRAASALAEARRLSGDDRYSSIARLTAVRYSRVPKVRALYEATYFAGLRKAGMREE